MKHLDLFSGIGGFALAADWVWPGIEHTFCDNDLFCQAVLKKHWPSAPIYGDIRTLTADAEKRRLQGRDVPVRQRRSQQTSPDTDRNSTERPFLLTGGFPCQPFSAAGRRRGTEDDRHLWPEMLRVIQEFDPEWVIGENVGGFLTWDGGVVFEQVLTDLESAGYTTQAFVIPACGLDAPHRRDRVWIVGHSASGNRSGEKRGRMERDVFPQSERKKIANTTDRSSVDASNSSECGRGKRNAVSRGSRKGTHAQKKRRGPADEAGNAQDTIGERRRGRNHGDQRGSGRKVQTTRSDTALHTRHGTDSEYSRLQGSEREKRQGYAGQRGRNRSEKRADWNKDWLEVAATLCTVDDGVPGRLVRPKGWRNAALKAAGNAIVPQVAETIMRAIQHAESYPQ